MKKNYIEPTIEFQSIALHSMIAASYIGFDDDPTKDFDIKSQIDFAEDIESDLFGSAEEW